MKRRVLISGILGMAMGVGILIPLVVDWISRGLLAPLSYAVASVALLFIIVGMLAGIRALRGQRDASPTIPPPVRSVLAACICFIAFCALEFSDGLLRQGGRVFYWTSVLFLPSLALLYGLASARRWAWWAARIVTAAASLWFIAFIVLIPFAHLQRGGVPTPWQGRVYMAGVSLIFAAIFGFAFRALARPDARTYFGQRTK